MELKSLFPTLHIGQPMDIKHALFIILTIFSGSASALDATLWLTVWACSRPCSSYDELGRVTRYEYADGKPQARVPFWKGDSDKTRLEPTTEAYEEYGEGGAQQVHLDRRTVKFDKVDILPEE